MATPKRKPVVVVSRESLELNVAMLRHALAPPGAVSPAFGRTPSYAPDVAYYSKGVQTQLAFFSASRLIEARLAVLLDRKTYDLRKANDLAAYYADVATYLLEV